MIKLIALDMDGTLVNKEGKISKYNEEVLKKAASLGIKIVLASGRPSLSLKNFFDQLSINDENDYTIAFNGSQVINNKTGEILYSKTILGKDMKRAFALSKKLNTNFYCYDSEENIVYQEESFFMTFEQKLTGNPGLQMNLENVDDNKTFIKMTFTDTKEKIDEITEIVKKEFSETHNVIRSHEYFLEVVNKTTSKGDALKFLTNHLNISTENVMSFGDNDNDYTLLLNSKYRMVMSNSKSELLRSIATEIAPDCNDSGVGKALIKYL